jgi:hypothetical protein
MIRPHEYRRDEGQFAFGIDPGFVMWLVNHETRPAKAYLGMEIREQVIQAAAENLGGAVWDVVIDHSVNP